jgi:predicted DNA-binding transcriptional regulator AlpA
MNELINGHTPKAASAVADRPAAGSQAPLAVEPLLLPAPAAAALSGISEATWYRLASAGRCPAPVRLSRGCVRWRAEEVRRWIEAGCPDRRAWEAMEAARRQARR